MAKQGMVRILAREIADVASDGLAKPPAERHDLRLGSREEASTRLGSALQRLTDRMAACLVKRAEDSGEPGQLRRA
jgi:hypothetical protein